MVIRARDGIAVCGVPRKATDLKPNNLMPTLIMPSDGSNNHIHNRATTTLESSQGSRRILRTRVDRASLLMMTPSNRASTVWMEIFQNTKREVTFKAFQKSTS